MGTSMDGSSVGIDASGPVEAGIDDARGLELDPVMDTSMDGPSVGIDASGPMEAGIDDAGGLELDLEAGIDDAGGLELDLEAGDGCPAHSYACQGSLVELAIEDRAHSDYPTFNFESGYLADADGLPMKEYKGVLTYNPVQLAQAGLEWAYRARVENDPSYRDRAEAAAQFLAGLAVEVDGAKFFPYRFDFTLHGQQALLLSAPWYSGMAQGEALSLFVRLWELTGDARYATWAHEVFATFSRFKGQDEPWIMDVDETGNTWVEEYPFAPATRVLNGFIFATFGLYDYYLMTRTREAEELLEAVLGTLRRRAGEFRNPDSISAYCLAHRIESAKYHDIHIRQLQQLDRMTVDDAFGRLARDFAGDTASPN